MHTNTDKLVIAGLLLGVGAFALTGCTGLDAALGGAADPHPRNAAALDESLDEELGWVPADARNITVKSSPRSKNPDRAVVFTSQKPLATDDCIEIERLSAPLWDLDPAIDIYGMETVLACGAWNVVQTDDGWLGWTTGTDRERARTHAAR